MDNLEELGRQIDRLANFIMDNIEGEPSQSQGAVDTAIRIMGDQAREVEGLRKQLAETADLAFAAQQDSIRLAGEVEGLRAEVATYRTALRSIAEYWNRDQNEDAMADACWHAILTAEAALAGKGG